MTHSTTQRIQTVLMAAFALGSMGIPTVGTLAQVVPNSLPIGTCISAYGSSGRIVDKVQGGYRVAPDADPTGVIIVAAASAVVSSCAGPTRTEAARAPRSAGTPSVNNAAVMHRRIQQDAADARSAKFSVGKYECRVGGQYTFSDLYVTGAGTYRVDPGGSGVFAASGGGFKFTSGPYRGAYGEMIDSHTIGISLDGSRNLATQCER